MGTIAGGVWMVGGAVWGGRLCVGCRAGVRMGGGGVNAWGGGLL